MPSVVSVSAAFAETNPAWGAHVAGDIGFLGGETATENPTTPALYTRVPLVGTRADTRATVDYKVALSGAEGAPVWPTIVVNHGFAAILAVRDVDPDDPFAFVAVGQQSSGNAITPGVMCPMDDVLVVYFISSTADTLAPNGITISALVCASLANLAIQKQGSTDTGNGGGLAIVTGEKANRGAIEPLTWTQGFASAIAVTILGLKPKRKVPYTGRVTLPDGSPVPDSVGSVIITDETAPDSVVVADIAGGDGVFSALVRYPGHTYSYKHDDGSSRGAGASAVP